MVSTQTKSNTKTQMTQSDYDTRKKFIKYMSACREIVIGRDKVISVATVGLIARANLMLLGRPGEGKSFLCSTMLENITSAKTFFTACSPETDMDAIFGTPVFEDLQHGRVKRNVTNTLADCHFAFIDEIGKASDSLHKSMFTALNERVFVNGTAGMMRLPLISTIAATNEALSSETAGLNSRFHLKAICHRLNQQERIELLTRRAEGRHLAIPDDIKLSLDDIKQSHLDMKRIKVPANIIAILVQLGETLELTTEPDSRKLEICIDLIKGSAYLRMKTECTLEDMEILKYALWDAPEHEPHVSTMVKDILDAGTFTFN